MTTLQGNLPRLCAFRALQMCLFPIAILTVFYRDVIQMSMRDIFVLQGAFGFAMMLVELPTGYLADRIGYRRTLLLASGIMAVGWAIYGAADRLATIVVAELVLGVAMGLISGTDVALLYESLLESVPENRDLLRATCSVFTQYAYAFVQTDAEAIEPDDFEASLAMKERALKLYLRGRGYCMRAMELRHHGVTMMSDPAEITAGAHAGGWAVYVRDPDGFTVELYQGPAAGSSATATASSGATRDSR